MNFNLPNQNISANRYDRILWKIILASVEICPVLSFPLFHQVTCSCHVSHFYLEGTYVADWNVTYLHDYVVFAIFKWQLGR